ncbi:MAG TPA: ADOP family duplicated permease, partial [Gemmatimonadaceae bacterium]|nr:ADOP family duplicated permease [Gemmatimonadaceae bacterium]
DLEDELAFHRDAVAARLTTDGHSPADALHAARRAMGNETLMREDARAVWLWPGVDALLQDARATLRGLRKARAFTFGVMVTFALGIGANAAMFSLVDRIMFRTPALMPDPGAVHRVYMYKLRDGVEHETGGQYARYADIARFTSSFSVVAAHTTQELAVGVGQDAREMRVGIVSASFFRLFDAPPALGRYFADGEDTPPAGAPVAVISWNTWQQRFGGRRDAIGATLHVGSVVYTIVGVTPKDFVGLWPMRPPVALIPVAPYGQSVAPDRWATSYGTAIGLSTIVRRKPGVSFAAAQADLANAFRRSYLTQVALDPRNEPIAHVRPRAVLGSVLVERGPERSDVARVAMWVAGVAIVVLLVACANVASLLLARAVSRRREIALRIALGVSRVRLLSQLLTESMLLALAGSALGLVLSLWLGGALRAAFLPGTEPAPVFTDPRTLLFVAVLTAVAGVFTGALPLLQTRRLALTDDLKSGGRGASGGHARSRARVALVVLQGAMSLVLLVGAGLFVRSLQHVRGVRLGFDADSVLVVEQHMRDVRLDSAQQVALRNRLLVVAATMPGVRHASFQFAVPFGGMASWPLFVEGIDSVDAYGEFDFNAVSPDYFATMGTRILRGRTFTDADVANATHVMVVGAAMAGVLWPDDDAIGKCVRVWADTMPCTRVVGVAEDIHTHDVGRERRSYYYYVPAAQARPAEGGLFVRPAGDARRAVERVRERLQREMPGASYVTVTPLANNVDAQMRSWVMGATLFTAFGALALLLAAVGLYSVIAYHVAQRGQELAVRVALGAAARDVMRLIVGEGVGVALAGTLLGALVALIAAPWIAPLLFDQSARDPVVYAAMGAVLLVVALVASAVPAIRGARINPSTALRAE